MTAPSLPNSPSQSSAKLAVDPPADLKKNEKKVYATLNAEERAAVFTTLQTWLTTPFASVDPTMLLYVEQQLSNLTGYNVSSQTPNLSLPIFQTVMSAMPHIKRMPEDSLSQHVNRLEAGMSRDRSFFGWLTPQSMAGPAFETIDEEYGVYLPLHLLADWSSSRDRIITEFKKQLILVINPFCMKLVVARCIGWWPPSPSHPTSGGTPELIASAQVWQITTLGRVVLFLINSDDNNPNLQPGSIKLTI